MNQIRLGLVGCGGMGQAHLNMIKDMPAFKIAAACDSFEANLTKVRDTYNVKAFTTPEQLLDSGEVDAILIATPHYFHVPITIAAIERGIHVLCEKPLSVTAAESQRAIDAHAKNPKVVFAMMHQMRAEPRWQLVKKLLTSGELGQMLRINWIVTTWYRTQAYYNSGSWRATWAGEGGGVLLNQCPHQLDLLWWLAGSPSKVTANVSLSKYHKIEVEDDVTAFLEYPNGATGVFVTSTGELAGTNRLEIVCDKGKIVVGNDGNNVEVFQSDISGRAFSDGTAEAWGKPTLTRAVYECGPSTGHKAAHLNFANAIQHGAPVLAPGAEGIHAVELGNAMIYSGLRKTAATYPTDRPAFDKLLAELVEDARKNKIK